MRYLKTFENYGSSLISDMEEFMGKKINKYFLKPDPMVDNATMVFFDGGSHPWGSEGEKMYEKYPKLKEWAVGIWYEREKDMEELDLWEALKYAPTELLDILGVDRDDLPKATYSPRFF